MKREEREYTILSITISDGTEIDMEDTQTLYRVCIGDFNAKSSDSVFEGKAPLIPEAEAPTDNETLIRLLREEGVENNGYFAVDDSPRGIEISTEQAFPQAA